MQRSVLLLLVVASLCAVNALNEGVRIVDTSPFIEEQYEIIPQTDYEMNTHQTFQLDYNYYPQIYSLELQEYDIGDGNTLTPRGERTMLEFGEYISSVDSLQGCQARMRGVFYDNWVERALPLNTNYKDTILVNEKLYLFTDTFLVQQLYVREDYETLTSIDGEIGGVQQSFRALVSGGDQSDVFASYLYAFTLGTDRVYVYTDVGCVSFDSKIDLSDPSFEFKQETSFGAPPRDRVYKVQAELNFALFAAGGDGVYIYFADQYEDLRYGGSLTVSDINQNSGLSLPRIDVRGVRWDPIMGCIAVLDYASGLHFFSASNSRNPQSSVPYFFYLPFDRGISFDGYLKTFIIVFEFGQQRRTYAVEIYIEDFYSRSYYINQYYTEIMSYNDVFVDEFVGILFSDFVHTVIVHTAYKDFQRLELKVNQYFAQFKPQSVHRYTIDRSLATMPETSQTHYLVSVSEAYVSVYRQTVITPRVICNTDDAFHRFYQLSMNASICAIQLQQVGINHDITMQQANLFSVCHSQHNFTVKAVEPRDEMAKKILMWVGIGLGVFVFVLIVAITGCCMYRRWKRNIEALEKERRLSQYDIFSEQVHDQDNASAHQGQTHQPQNEANQIGLIVNVPKEFGQQQQQQQMHEEQAE